MPAYKLIPILTWLLSALPVLPAFSQDEALQRKVRVGQREMNIGSLGKTITQQSQLILSYDARIIHPGLTVQLSQREYSVQQLLELIRRQTKMDYRLIGDHVILTKPAAATGNSSPPAVGDGRRKQPVHGERPNNGIPAGKHGTGQSANDAAHAQTGKPDTKQITKGAALAYNIKPDARQSANDAALVYKSKPGTEQPAHMPQGVAPENPANGGRSIGAVNRTPPTHFPGLHQPVRRAAVVPRVATSLPRLRLSPPVEPIVLRPSGSANSGWSPEWQVTGGLSADLAFVLNPLLRGGIPEAYAILGWRSNFRTSGPQFGAGASIPLEERWTMRLELTTGPLKREAILDSAAIRTGSVDLKGWLHSGAVLVDRKIGRHFRLMAGPGFNVMTTGYYYGGVKTAPNDIPGTGRDNDAAFSFFKAPLQLSNDFSRAKSSHRTIWLNFHLGIFYRI